MNRSLVLSLSLLLGACGMESAIVGGECRPGYSAETGRCLPRPAVSIIPGPTADAPPAASTITSPATPSHADPSDAPSAAPVAQPAGPVAVVEATPPVVVVTPEPPTTCVEGFVACRGGCLRVLADGQNCGACGRVCPSNICAAGVCQGATPGDVVVIGHDMASAPTFSTHARVFANAVSIPKTDPLRVLAFEADASEGVRARTRDLTTAESPSRAVRFAIASSPAALEDDSLYASWDVVILDAIARENATALGERWSHALDAFTRRGGVLVALDDGHGDLPGFFGATSLLSLGARTELAPDAPLVVAAPNDVVGAQLLSPYATFGAASAYDAVASAGVTWVVTSTDGRPVVLHRVAR